MPSTIASDATTINDAAIDRVSYDTLLLEAAQKGWPHHIESMIKRRADPNASDAFGRTALHFVAASGDAGSAEMLLNAGADIDAPDMAGSTPLHYATANGSANVVDLLIRAGANLDAVDATGPAMTRVPLGAAAALGGYGLAPAAPAAQLAAPGYVGPRASGPGLR